MYGGPAAGPPRGWALVDVETTGLSPDAHRVLSVACRTVESDGRVSAEWSSLVDPGCDPGPVHIHGITRERLRGAPTFDQVAEQLHRMVEGRVLVAHNAKFDHSFLRSESRRHGRRLPVDHRLCTLTASRRLGLPVENYRLPSLAKYWGVRQTRWHDALDDVRVLSEIFVHTRAHASRLGIDLPVLECGDDVRAGGMWPARAPRVPCLYVNPPTWRPGEPLVQGAKVVITGDTRSPRSDWHDLLAARGLNPMNSVSRQTRLLVCDDPRWASAKLTRARELGVPVVTEDELHRLVQDVRPGRTPEDVAAERARAARETGPSRRVTATGPWSGRVVVVMGGAHEEAAELRDRIGRMGGRVLVSLGSTVTHVVALDGAENDRRWPKVLERGLSVVGSDLEVRGVAAAVAGREDAHSDLGDAVVMVRGEVVDLPAGDLVVVDASWASGGPVVDVVAFALGADDRVRNDDDFVFYNQPVTSGLALDVDGDAEQGIEIDLDQLGSDVERVRVVAVVDGAGTFGEVGAVVLTTEVDRQAFATAVLDAASVETALVLAEIYRRGEVWRMRVVGRGYEQSLAELAVASGVDVEA